MQSRVRYANDGTRMLIEYDGYYSVTCDRHGMLITSKSSSTVENKMKSHCNSKHNGI